MGESPSELAASFDPIVRGTMLGIVSAIAYTGANIALRDLSRSEGVAWAMWVASIKAVPCCLTSWAFVLYRRSQGKQSLPPAKFFLPLLCAALMMQFGGNAAFTWALSKAGLVLTVPMTFSTLICGSAILGRIVLGEPIGRRTVASIVILLLSIICLSVAADRSSTGADFATVAGGMCLAGIAGLSYGANSIVIRRFLGSQLSVSSIIVVMSTTGVFVLGTVAFISVGTDRIANTTPHEWRSLVCAGLANAVAFYSVSTALKYIPAVRANLLNASQTAMCAAAGVLFFQEQITPLLACGIGLTIAGLALLGIRKRKSPLGVTPLVQPEISSRTGSE